MQILWKSDESRCKPGWLSRFRRLCHGAGCKRGAGASIECLVLHQIRLDNRGLTFIYIRSRMLRRRNRSWKIVPLCGQPPNRPVKATRSANAFANLVQGATHVGSNVTEFMNFRNRMLCFDFTFPEARKCFSRRVSVADLQANCGSQFQRCSS